MIDLTQSFAEAAIRSSDWSEQDFEAILTAITNTWPEFSIDWDKGAGETWALIAKSAKMVGIVRSDAPLIIMLDKYVPKLRFAVEKQMTVIVPVENFEDPQYMLELALAQNKPFRRWLWRSQSIDPRRFSIRDLWWVTI